MIRLLPASACACALLLTATLSAQQTCPGGRDDSEGFVVSSAFAAHPTRVADVVDSVLAAAGYEVRQAPAGAGHWAVAPRFTFVDGLLPEAVDGVAHPGVQVRLRLAADADSARLEASAHTLCRTMRAGRVDEELETALELLSAGGLVAQVEERMEALAAAGTDLAAPVDRAVAEGGFSLTVPDAVGEFRMADREDFDDPRLGSSFRYARPDGLYLDLYVYPGPPADASCPQACAARRVDEEIDGFVQGIPEIVRRGYYRRLRVRDDERVSPPAGAAWRAGRHVTFDAVRGEGPETPQESLFVLYAFPGYMVKVRATYPPSAEAREGVHAFVSALLPALVAQR